MSARRWWPVVPIALLVLASGALNLAAGLGYLAGHYNPFVEASRYNGTLSVFGHSTQAVLGAAPLLCGIGLFWRLRTPWAFSLLLGALVVGVNVLRMQWDAALIVPTMIFVALVA